MTSSLHHHYITRSMEDISACWSEYKDNLWRHLNDHNQSGCSPHVTRQTIHTWARKSYVHGFPLLVQGRLQKSSRPWRQDCYLRVNPHYLCVSVCSCGERSCQSVYVCMSVCWVQMNSTSMMSVVYVCVSKCSPTQDNIPYQSVDIPLWSLRLSANLHVIL